MNRKKFKAELESLYEMLHFIRDHAVSVGFSQSNCTNIELAAEEALVNVISYGYVGTEGTIEIYCEPINQIGLKITLKDQGIPYNPIENQIKPEDRPPHEKKIGGYGIFFIMSIMDDVTYARLDDSNILTMTKYVNVPAS